jgi:hypothetical protein
LATSGLPGDVRAKALGYLGQQQSEDLNPGRWSNQPPDSCPPQGPTPRKGGVAAPPPPPAVGAAARHGLWPIGTSLSGRVWYYEKRSGTVPRNKLLRRL